MVATGPIGMGPGPRPARFSWRIFGLVLLVVVTILAGLIIARVCTGWGEDETHDGGGGETSGVMWLLE